MRITKRQVWLILGIETLGLAVLAAWVLSRLDRLLEPGALAIAVVIIVAGDLAAAVAMQRFARSEITVAPGEAPQIIGRVVTGFAGERAGNVLVRGEHWRAEIATTHRLEPGDPVRVVSRKGLTLLIEPWDPAEPG